MLESPFRTPLNDAFFSTALENCRHEGGSPKNMRVLMCGKEGHAQKN
jgi:hypothetical protein